MWIGVTDREEEGVYRTVDGALVDAGTAKWLPGTPDNWFNLSNEGLNQQAVTALYSRVLAICGYSLIIVKVQL